MISTVQKDFIEMFVAQHYKQGYKYYICHTNTNLTNPMTYNFYDLTFYFSKEPIKELNDYTFATNSTWKAYEVITRNVSNNQSDSKVERIKEISHKSNVTIDNYEFILTNSENSYYMNVIATEEISYLSNIGYNISLNDYIIIPVLLSALLIFQWLRTWFANNGGVEL